MTVDTASPETRFLRGPGVCGNDQAALDWAGTRVVGLEDGTRFGIRSTSRALLDAVEALYADQIVAEEGPALYSLHVGEPGRRKAAPLHYLYHGGQVSMGTRDLGRLVRGLVSHAAQILNQEPTEPSVLGTPVLLPDGSVLLAPPELAMMARQVDRLLTARGTAVADTAWVRLVPSGSAGAQVAVIRPEVGPDPDALDLDALRALGPSAVEPVVAAGARPLSRWLASVPPDAVGVLRRAQAAASTASLLRRPYPGGTGSALDALLDVVGSTVVEGVSWRDQDDLVGQVAAHVDPGAS